ncbi:MAG: hypothetical protein V4565_08270 [Bacteroidota bacterium]
MQQAVTPIFLMVSIHQQTSADSVTELSNRDQPSKWISVCITHWRNLSKQAVASRT